MSSTGRWVGHGCDLAEYRCLCEYGPEVPLTYHSDMQAYADALSAVVWRYRAKIGALLVVALGLPLLLDKQFKSICCSTLTFRPHARKGVMVVVVWHAGWMLLFCGFAPLFLHYGWAAWDMARLGAWPFYTPLAPWGGFLMTECSDPSNIRNISTIFAILYLAITATCTSNVARVLSYGEFGPNSEFELSYLFMWGGFGVLSLSSCCSMLFASVGGTKSPLAVYNKIWFHGRLIAGGSGAFLFLVFLVPIMIKDLHFVMHPYAAGSVLTSISWLGFGAGSRPNNLRLQRAALLTPSRS